MNIKTITFALAVTFGLGMPAFAQLAPGMLSESEQLDAVLDLYSAGVIAEGDAARALETAQAAVDDANMRLESTRAKLRDASAKLQANATSSFSDERRATIVEEVARMFDIENELAESETARDVAEATLEQSEYVTNRRRDAIIDFVTGLLRLEQETADAEIDRLRSEVIKANTATVKATSLAFTVCNDSLVEKDPLACDPLEGIELIDAVQHYQRLAGVGEN